MHKDFNSKIPIIYEDNHLLVVEKAPNQLTQGDSTGDMDLLTGLKEYLKVRYNKPGEAYLGLVHRMDRPVGGALCFAKTSKAAARLSSQLQKKKLHRQYLLIAQGEVNQPGTLEDYLLKDSKTNLVKVVSSNHPQGKKALLTYEPLLVQNGQTLVKVSLQTGRSHQIRVQFSHFGHPLYGDMRYGEQWGRPVQIALWGHFLSLEHPTLEKQMSFLSLPKGPTWKNFEEVILAFSSPYIQQGAYHR